MKKFLFFLFLFIYLNPICVLSFYQEKLLSQSGVVVELVYRAFEPGEIIVVSIKDSSAIKKAEVRFLKRKFFSLSYDSRKSKAITRYFCERASRLNCHHSNDPPIHE